MKKNNHIDSDGNVQMVDINEKDITHRKAIASGYISLSKEALESIKGGNKKGDVLTVAQIAGIQAAKNTSMLIPLAHQLNIISININFKIKEDRVECTSKITCDGKTGVEIEALCAAQISLLTIYDMCKYIDKSMIISEVKLVLKEGGKSGSYEAK
jgi:cyclic pyranopterin monophosphate synthase|tara:strand:- start:1746 stop:2213 length:468 start_codon:yes stop_codon:yes gene_type:complete